MMLKPELVAPAGDLEKLVTAVRYGADAVYLSGTKYGLRASSGNFDRLELVRAVTFAHEHGVRAYITLNAFLHDDDLQGLGEYCRFLEEQNVDAVIVSDAGVAGTVRHSSSLPIHLSTQASCLNSLAASAWKEMGVRRVVLAREVSLREASHIAEQAGLEVEIFIHGAMCMAYSGRCSLSTYTAGRDANRGGCIHSCRFPYTLENSGRVEHRLSSKDLCALPHLCDIAASPVRALKIEGRMKSVFHAALVTSVYRRALDSLAEGAWSEDVRNELITMLQAVPHRDYFDGSLRNPAGMGSVYRGNTNTAKNATHRLVASVLETDGTSLLLKTYQPLTTGSRISFLAFNGRFISIEVSDLRDVLGERSETIRQESLAVLPAVEGVKKGQVVVCERSGNVCG